MRCRWTQGHSAASYNNGLFPLTIFFVRPRVHPYLVTASATPPYTRLLTADMQALDALIAQQLQSGVVLVSQVAQYIVASGGKRIRPVLLMLMSRALGVSNPRIEAQRINLAAVVEFIHTATLLHDDVVDDSQLRRGRPTANNSFGNPASVLVGDFIYTRAFQMMVAAGDMRIMQILADATNVIAEGEVLQLMNVHDASVDEARYLQVIQSKTAKLFEASCRLAAVLAGSSAEVEAACADFGSAIGTAFQIIDDALDYDGEVAAIGKNVGDDLREGKVTLPLLFAMQKASAEDAAIIRHAIETGGLDELPRISDLVHSTGALEATRVVAAKQAQRASDLLVRLPDNPYRAALLEMAQAAVARRV